MLYDICYMLYDTCFICYILHAICFMLYYMLYDTCYMLYANCYMIYAICYMKDARMPLGAKMAPGPPPESCQDIFFMDFGPQFDGFRNPTWWILDPNLMNFGPNLVEFGLRLGG